MPNAPFKCGFPEYTRAFSKFSAFKFHAYCHRDKKNRIKLDSAGHLKCHFDFCSTKCEDIQGLLHLKSHIIEDSFMTFQTM